MTVPYKYRFFAPYIKYFTSSDWVKFSLDLLGGRGKIGVFRYAPLIGPDILSGILVKATGQSVLDFVSENLFEPLGIEVENNLSFQSKGEQMAFNQSTDISVWATDPTGIHAVRLLLNARLKKQSSEVIIMEKHWGCAELCPHTGGGAERFCVR